MEKKFNHIKRSLVAGVTQQINHSGDAFYFLVGDADITVKIDQGSGMTIAPALGMRVKEFTAIEITSSTNQDIEFLIGSGDIFDNRNLTSSTPITVNPTPSNTGDSFSEVSVTSGSAVQVLTGSSDQLEVTIQASSSNTSLVRLGFDNTVSATKGIELQPNGTYTAQYSGDLYCYQNSGSTQKMNIFRLRRV